jgi:hypothetical protein
LTWQRSIELAFSEVGRVATWRVRLTSTRELYATYLVVDADQPLALLRAISAALEIPFDDVIAFAPTA